MADIRFHTVNAAGGGARFRHACKLIEQAWHAGERVLVWLEDAGTAERFDQLLWTFSDRAFVPHEPLAIDPGASEARNAVVISTDDGVTWSSATELATVGHLLLGVAIT